MHNVRRITDDVFYTGVNDRRLALFENSYPVAGASYNSYVLLDEKTVVFDTADSAVTNQYLDNVRAALNGRKADFLVVHHMEPDHSASIKALIAEYPDIKVICNAKSLAMIKNFFFDIGDRAVVVKDGEEVSFGKHTLKFVFAPMVHWPEVMISVDLKDNILFSADAFGSFGALDGNIFSDETDFDAYLPEARRYYTNIVGKYGPQVKAALKKLEGLNPAYVCPLHGVIWKNNFNKIVAKYSLWADYTPEEDGVVIMYGSVYGHTAEAADILAGILADRGIGNIKVYDVSKTHYSYLVAEAFRASNLVFASVTTNACLFPAMEKIVKELSAHNMQKRTVSIIQNGSWAAVSGSKIKDEVSSWKDSFIAGDIVSIVGGLKESQIAELEKLADSIVLSLARHVEEVKLNDNTALFKLTYGLFVLTARENQKDNGCIINTAMQITDNPKRVSVSVNKSGYTCGMIERTGNFNVSVLTENAKFDLFKRFGFASGRDTEKFSGNVERTSNGIAYISDSVNAVISVKVTETHDCGTHRIFIGEVTEMKHLSNVQSATYDYYFKHIKPAPPAPQKDEKKGVKRYVCKICGYVHEGDLPDDYVCPICKHGKDAFELMK